MLKTPNRLELERQAVASILKFPELFAEIDGIIKENFFSNRLHQVIFSVIRNTLLEPRDLKFGPADSLIVDKFTVANKIINLNISFEIDIY